MFESVKSFYAKGNAFESAFAVLMASAATFMAISSVAAQVALYFGTGISVMLAISMFGACVLAMAIALRGRAFAVPRAAKIGLLATFAVSFAVYHLIL